LLPGTVKFWQNWLSACTQGRLYEAGLRGWIERLIAVGGEHPTGAIIAAPTTSLPEVIGGARNWDYRYTWIRDAAFTVYAFLRIGFRDEAAAFMRWIEDKNAISNGILILLRISTSDPGCIRPWRRQSPMSEDRDPADIPVPAD